MRDGSRVDTAVRQGGARGIGGQCGGESDVEVVALAGRGGVDHAIGLDERGSTGQAEAWRGAELSEHGVPLFDRRGVEDRLDAPAGEAVEPLLRREEIAHVPLPDAGGRNRRADRDDAGRHGAT